ncbi:MAG: hypothetical protein VCB06_09220 [Alphaproteobacteria bacterium]
MEVDARSANEVERIFEAVTHNFDRCEVEALAPLGYLLANI